MTLNLLLGENISEHDDDVTGIMKKRRRGIA